MAVSKALRNALRWGDEERDELAAEFLDHKVFTYVETLGELLEQHGVEFEPDDIDLTDDILRALRAEARSHAAMVVETFNSDLEGFLQRNADLGRDELLASYETWAEARADARSETIAITEAYTAAADATLAFYAANVGEAEFDFGGHPELGDDDPQCAVCEALVSTSPHPHARVVEVGNPHIGCRQSWHARDAEMPDEVKLPDAPAGIVGAEPWVNRHGNDHDAAAEALRAAAEVL